MDIKKFAPWNWFKKETEEDAHPVIVKNQYGHSETGLRDSMDAFHKEVDRLFNSVFRDMRTSDMDFGRFPLEGISGSLLKPRLDLGATDDEYSVFVEIPGVDKDHVNLEIINDVLTVRGEKKKETQEKNKHFYRLERSYGAFQRVLSLPEDADAENIKAIFKNGVLQVRIPRKARETEKRKQIEIHSE